MSMSERLNLRLPDGPAKKKLEEAAAAEKRARQKLEKEQSEKYENRGRREGTPPPRKHSSNVDREESPTGERPQKTVRTPRPARDFQDFAKSRNNGSEVPTDRRARGTSRVRNNDPQGRPESKRHTYEQTLPERPRQKHRKNPADDFYSDYIDRERAEELKCHREIKHHERHIREEEEEQERKRKRQQERQDERDRKEEEELERAWRDNLRRDRERVAQEIASEESARQSKPRTATKKKMNRDEGDRETRERSGSRDRYHRDHAREGRAPPDIGGGDRPKSYIRYEYKPVHIPKLVPKPEVDRRGGERVRRANSTVRQPKNRDAREPRSRDIGGADPDERDAPPLAAPRTGRSTRGRPVDNNPELYSRHNPGHDPRHNPGYDPRYDDSRYDDSRYDDPRYDQGYDTSRY
ncbi:hypothetical protein EAF00_004806 [Botryotinia globosa]|nr:hypothetical protein EAF00_004806 [Botryotinia globosa]